MVHKATELTTGDSQYKNTRPSGPEGGPGPDMFAEGWCADLPKRGAELTD